MLDALPAGDWATWTGDIINFLIVVGTVAAVLVAWGTYVRDRAAARTAAEAEKAEVARRLAAEEDARARWQQEFDQRAAADRAEAERWRQDVTERLAVQERERTERLQQQQRAQAEQVCGWIGTTTIRTSGQGAPVGDAVPCAYLRNASSVPVYDVRIDFVFNNPDVEPVGPVEVRGSVPVAVLPPTTDPIAYKVPKNMIRTITDPTDIWLAVAVSFRDAAGVRWKRDHHGVLRVISTALIT